MKDTIIAIIISIIASFLYYAIKNLLHRRKEPSTHANKFSKKYFSSVKKEFYISLPIGIAFSTLPDTASEFINVGMRTTSFISFFISLMAFMCLVEMIEHFANDDTDNNP